MYIQQTVGGLIELSRNFNLKCLFPYSIIINIVNLKINLIFSYCKLKKKETNSKSIWYASGNMLNLYNVYVVANIRWKCGAQLVITV